MAEALTIVNRQAPGDHVVMSAAVRDLHRSYPGRYETFIDVSQKAVFDGNPLVAPYPRAGAQTLNGTYSNGPWRIQLSNQQPRHFLWGFIGDLNKNLKLDIQLSEFKPDLHLTAEEKAVPLFPKPYWVFGSGGKTDFTAKWWHPDYWKTVVDNMKLWTPMVQIGASNHTHPIIPGAIDMVGKTNFRDLMRMIYHAEGVICVVTCFMHIAAAFNKPCVVVAGGREHWWWEAYTEENRLINMRHGNPQWTPPPEDKFIPHQFLHTLGQLDCCKTRGCWKSHVQGRVSPERMCTKIVQMGSRPLPKCMQLVTPDHVLHGVEWYYKNGILGRAGTVSVTLPALPPPQQLPLEVPELRPLTNVVRDYTNKPTVHFLVDGGQREPLAKLKAILPTALPNEYSLKVYTIKPDAELIAYCAAKGWETVEVSSALDGFQRAAAVNNADKLIWVQTPVVLHGGWLQHVTLPRIANGMIYWRSLQTAEVEQLTQAWPGWPAVYPLLKHPFKPQEHIAYYLDPAFMVLPQRALLRAMERLKKLELHNFHVMLSEGLRQEDIELSDAGHLIKEL